MGLPEVRTKPLYTTCLRAYKGNSLWIVGDRPPCDRAYILGLE